jgi:hypothetical protein
MAVCSLLHFPASHLDWPLASTLPCGAPTFLRACAPRSPDPLRWSILGSLVCHAGLSLAKLSHVVPKESGA